MKYLGFTHSELILYNLYFILNLTFLGFFFIIFSIFRGKKKKKKYFLFDFFFTLYIMNIYYKFKTRSTLFSVIKKKKKKYLGFNSSLNFFLRFNLKIF
jgi:hypothetical protein